MTALQYAHRSPQRRRSGRITGVSTRPQIAENALASVRLEGLEPSAEILEIGSAWARGEATDEDLVDAEQRLLADADVRTRAR